MRSCTKTLIVGFALSIPTLAVAQQRIDSAYTAKIRELTPTDPKWKFSTELVDYLRPHARCQHRWQCSAMCREPSASCPTSPISTATSPRSPKHRRGSKLFSLGQSDEGREMILAAIADEATIARLDDYRSRLGRLADPRAPGRRADSTDTRGKPITGSPVRSTRRKTGSPEMLMELAYRLAVDESEHVRQIRTA